MRLAGEPEQGAGLAVGEAQAGEGELPPDLTGRSLCRRRADIRIDLRAQSDRHRIGNRVGEIGLLDEAARIGGVVGRRLRDGILKILQRAKARLRCRGTRRVDRTLQRGGAGADLALAGDRKAAAIRIGQERRAARPGLQKILAVETGLLDRALDLAGQRLHVGRIGRALLRRNRSVGKLRQTLLQLIRQIGDLAEGRLRDRAEARTVGERALHGGEGLQIAAQTLRDGEGGGVVRRIRDAQSRLQTLLRLLQRRRLAARRR